MSRVIFHIDLNAFFVNAEILLDPSLKGKPVAVAMTTRRSVLSTCSYEARSFGLHSAMSVYEALRLCPGLQIVEPHFSYYRQLSQNFIDIVRTYTDKVEQASIDECYADMTDIIYTYDKPLDLAWLLQRKILKETGLPCSIGVGPNMLLAKMASDMKKPMGITVLRLRDVQEKMWPLPIEEMRGIGAKTVPFLTDLGISTIGDLAGYENKDELRVVFGNHTEDVINKAWGYDDRRIVSEHDEKSISVSETFLEDITDYDEIKGLLRHETKKISLRLRQIRKAAGRLGLRLCYYDFHNVERSMKLAEPLFSFNDIFVKVMKLFDDNWEGDSLRLIGVSLSDFVDDEEVVKQINLFDNKKESLQETVDVIYDLNKQMGTKAFFRASGLLSGDKHES